MTLGGLRALSAASQASHNAPLRFWHPPQKDGDGAQTLRSRRIYRLPCLG